MDRRQFAFLEHWLAMPDRKPLVLRGARQVGKSTLVRLFAERSRRALAEVNLERHADLAPAFARNDPAYLLNVLEALPDIGSIGPDGLLFIDEIQSVPEAIPALRYLREDMRDLPVLAAGSLLDFVLADHRFSMPVGRVAYLHMGPMTFTEFLNAVGAERLASMIATFEIARPLDPAIHNRLMELLRTYLFTGGMPESVRAYARSRRLRDAGEVHRSIIDTYREDFPKYVGSRSLPRIVNVFNFAARNVGRKVKYIHFSREATAATTRADIELLCMARVLSKVVHSHCNGLPLQADSDPRAFKLIFMDIGLMNAVCGLGWTAIEGMNETRLVNEGAMAEQFIGQHLQDLLAGSPNRELTYWLREGRATNAEVDYVAVFDGNIVPIEVKAGSSGGLKSLHQFVAEKGVQVAVRFDAAPPSIQTVRTTVRRGGMQADVSYRLLSLPLYLVEGLPSVLVSLRR
ncbi:MAG: ATP-binding protein [Thiotrichales bacterium]|nr:ATP-binding protein [Thiotrichales bacterium]